MLSAWRRERDKALAKGLAPRKRGRKPTQSPSDERAARLERENARLRRELDQARLIINIQKKTSQLLGIEPAEIPESGNWPENGENE